jgi:flagellin-like protein
MTYITSKQQKMTSRRAVAPIIATLLLIAIAVVGGSIIFVFSQGFFSSAQVSGAPQIESVRITGYDSRDTSSLTLHDGLGTGVGIAQGLPNNGLVKGERVAVYLQNNSVQKVTLSEIRLAGTVYSFVPIATGLIDANTSALLDSSSGVGKFTIATNSNGVALAETAASVLTTTAAELQPGQQATVILELAENVKTGRDAQFKLTTTNGAVFVGTVIAGQQSG